MAEKTLLVVDGYSYAYRAFYAIPKLTSPRGEPTNAILGFLKMLRKLGDQFQPSHWLVAWDAGLPQERLKILESYKAQRKPMPEELRAQIPGIRAVLEASKIVSLQQEGYEADDIIASVWRQAGPAKVMIASADKDLLQLVNDHTVGIRQAAKNLVVMDDAAVKERFGVAPNQILDLLCLTGDSSDNVPGVAGVGEKTAAQLLNRFGTAEAMIARLAEIESPRLRAALEESVEKIRRNRILMSLNEKLPVDVQWDRWSRQEPDYDRLMVLFEQFGFKSLFEETRSLAQKSPQGQLLLGD